MTKNEKLFIRRVLSVLKASNPGKVFKIIPVLYGADAFIKGNIPIEALMLPDGYYTQENRIRHESNTHELDGIIYECS